MSTRKNLIRLGCLTITMWCLTVALAWGAYTPDAGLVTGLSGEVTYVNSAEKQVPAKAQSFLKIREGDQFKLAPRALLQLTYFASGRQEIWHGPVTVEVGDQGGRAAGHGQAQSPEVKVLAFKVAKRMAGAALAASRAGSPDDGVGQPKSEQLQTSGVIRTMAPTRSPAPPAAAAPLPARDSQAVAEAEKTYQDLKRAAQPGDLTPEIYLVGIYADNGQYGKMARIIDLMLAQRPQDENLRKFKAWARSRAAGD